MVNYASTFPLPNEEQPCSDDAMDAEAPVTEDDSAPVTMGAMRRLLASMLSTVEQSASVREGKLKAALDMTLFELKAVKQQLQQQEQRTAALEQAVATLSAPAPRSYAAAVASGIAGQAPPPPARAEELALEHRDGFKMSIDVDPKSTGFDALSAVVANTVAKLKTAEGRPLEISIQAARLITSKPRSSAAHTDVLANSVVRGAHQGCPTDASTPTARSLPTVFFRVREGDADSIRKLRTQLKGTGLTIHDWLTEAERAQQRALWPAFKEAREKKAERTFWRRGRLFVKGEEVVPPSPSAAGPSA